MVIFEEFFKFFVEFFFEKKEYLKIKIEIKSHTFGH